MLAKPEDRLIAEHTSFFFTRHLFNINNNLAIICDGTYIRHQKSRKNNCQRKLYFYQKKTPLCKPLAVITTYGYIIDMAGFSVPAKKKKAVVLLKENNNNNRQTEDSTWIVKK